MWIERISHDSFLVLFNASGQAVRFTLPSTPWASRYETVVDTAALASESGSWPVTHALKAGKIIDLEPHSSVVLRAT